MVGALPVSPRASCRAQRRATAPVWGGADLATTRPLQPPHERPSPAPRLAPVVRHRSPPLKCRTARSVTSRERDRALEHRGTGRISAAELGDYAPSNGALGGAIESSRHPLPSNARHVTELDPRLTSPHRRNRRSRPSRSPGPPTISRALRRLLDYEGVSAEGKAEQIAESVRSEGLRSAEIAIGTARHPRRRPPCVLSGSGALSAVSRVRPKD